MDFTSQPGIVPSVGASFAGRTPVTCLSYHENGQRLYAASELDSKLQIIDCMNGKLVKLPLKCERETILNVEATHHEECVIFSGKGAAMQPTGLRYAVNYWSVHDNKILRKFRGHTGPVNSLSMCPANDTFISASSHDKTVRLWSLQSAGCVAQLKLPSDTARAGEASTAGGGTSAVFDSTGLVFAVTARMENENQGQYVHLYDARNYTGGAFAEFKVLQPDLVTAILSHVNTTPEHATEMSQTEWRNVQFNVSGNQILVNAGMGMSLLLDGFEGTIQRVLAPMQQLGSDRPAVTCFTPDDMTVLLGNYAQDGAITCMDVATSSILSQLQTVHPGPITCLKANPKYAQFASSCTNTALWLW